MATHAITRQGRDQRTGEYRLPALADVLQIVVFALAASAIGYFVTLELREAYHQPSTVEFKKEEVTVPKQPTPIPTPEVTRVPTEPSLGN